MAFFFLRAVKTVAIDRHRSGWKIWPFLVIVDSVWREPRSHVQLCQRLTDEPECLEQP